MIPLTSVMFIDEVHGAFTHVFGSSWPVYVVRGFLQLIVFLPNGVVGLQVVALGLITLIYLNRSIRQVGKFVKNLNKIGNQIAISYRSLQLLVVICNEVFQTYFWPLIQFVGSCFGINFLYFLLEYAVILPFGLTLIIIACVVVLIGLCCLMLDVGSRPILLSSSILKRVKYRYDYDWSRKFWRSCKPISLDIGPFHKMDRSRGPAFLRFILQRTFFLSVQSRNFRQN